MTNYSNEVTAGEGWEKERGGVLVVPTTTFPMTFRVKQTTALNVRILVKCIICEYLEADKRLAL